MKILKIIALLLMINISNVYAMDKEVIDTKTSIEMTNATVDVVSIPSPSMDEELFNVAKLFLSYTLLGFAFCLVFPKFTKKTTKVFFETKKIHIVFKGLTTVFLTITAGAVFLFLGIGSSIGVFILSAMLALFALGIPMLNMVILEWLFKRNNVKIEKLSKTNKFTSILSVNIILMLITLPFLWLIPDYKATYQDTSMYIDIAFPAIIAFMSILGIGATVIHLKEVFDKHRKKL